MNCTTEIQSRFIPGTPHKKLEHSSETNWLCGSNKLCFLTVVETTNHTSNINRSIPYRRCNIFV
jgi:hypothetical protein